VPNVAESITEGTLKQWTKKVGDSVTVDEEVATIETDKVDVSVNATHTGKIVELLANEEDTVTVGNDLFRIEEDAEGECKLRLLSFVSHLTPVPSLCLVGTKRGTESGPERGTQRGNERAEAFRGRKTSKGGEAGYAIIVRCQTPCLSTTQGC
jgi:pyruvate/2-oxoglutarate dehydrogenase complex dihydrolipoamide acyltransferase (E2) component